ncbi:hypothetical protein C0991_005986 [Blastosporella zonata]|nr:hypothetical protein C0991_005986 [Blastosporella zonata]
MAKSLRSKTKRTFRNKKREDGIYAATEAARLHRLNAKLVATTSKDPEGDVVPSVEGGEDEIPGWCWLTTIGLLDPDDITLESMEALTRGETGHSIQWPLMQRLKNVYLHMGHAVPGEKNGGYRKD